MNSLFENMTEYLLGQSVHIVWLFLLVGAVCLTLRKKSAHLRYLLWLLIIAKCLVPSLVTISLAILPERAEPVVERVVYEPVAEPEVFVPAVTEYVPMKEAPVDTRPVLIQYITSLSKEELLAFAWMVGAGLFLVLIVIKAVRTNTILTKNRGALPDSLQVEVSELLGGNNGAGPKCYCIDGIAQPFVWGLVRGSIYLPADFMVSTDGGHRRQILMHEMAHITRRDPVVNFLQIIAQVVFFFHPLVWVANKFIRAEREKCCDEAAIARLDASPKDYGKAIVDTLINEYESTMPTPSMAIAGPIKNIENRIKTIMQPGRKFYKRPTVIAILMILLFAAVTVPVGCALSNREAKDLSSQIDKDASENSEDSEFKKTLPNGVTVELIGVCEHPSEGKQWWNANGKAIDIEPYDNNPGKVFPDEKQITREMAIKLYGKNATVNDAHLRWEIPNSSTSSGTVEKHGQQLRDVQAVVLGVDKKNKKLDFELGIAAGKWSTKSKREIELKGILTSGVIPGGITWNRPSEPEKGVTAITVVTKDTESDIRIVAVGKGGKIIVGGSSDSHRDESVVMINAEFDAPISEIKEFQYRSRPYEWIEFKNVSLKPNFKTDSPKAKTAVLLADDYKVMDLATGTIIDIPKEIKFRDGWLKYIEQNCDVGVLYDYENSKPRLSFVNASHIDRSTRNMYGIEMMSFASKNVPYEVVVTAKDGEQYKIKVTKAEKEACHLSYYQMPNIKTDVGVEAQGNKLEFRILPDSLISSRAPNPLRLEDEMEYRKDLRENGADAGRKRGDDYIWLETEKYDPANFSQLVTEKVGEKGYVLAANLKDKRMLATGSWGLQKVYATKDPMGRPSIKFECDIKGSELFYKLTSGNIKTRLGIIINGNIYAAPQINEAIRGQGIIAGSFSEAKVKGLVEMLSKSMPPVEVEGGAKRYAVNRAVVDFPEGDDLSTPEAAYATMQRINASDQRHRWAQVTVKRPDGGLDGLDESDNANIPPDLQEWWLNTIVSEVMVYGNYASVIGQMPSELQGESVSKPFDYREFRFENGKWLYAFQGGRVATLEEAREKFQLSVEDSKKPSVEKPAVQPESVRMIDAARWSEGKAMMGTISSAIRAWVAENMLDGSWTQDELTLEKLGFIKPDLRGTYFRAENFSWQVSFDKANTKLTFTITATAGKGITAPVSVTLDEKGKWTEQQKSDVGVDGGGDKKASWEKVFYELYRLEDGEVLKRIAPPFIPERKGYYHDRHASQAKSIPDPPDYFTFHWDGELKNWGLGFGEGASSLNNVLNASLSIPDDQFEGPKELLKFPVGGDWIVRKNVSDAEKLRALEKILLEELGEKIIFQKRKVVREVIVAKGEFKFSRPSGTYDDRRMHFYSDKLDPRVTGVGKADTVAELINVLGQRTGLQVIDETRNSSEKIDLPYGHHRSSRLSFVNTQAKNSTKLKMMLKNLEKQTNLRFTIKERTVSKWIVTGDGYENSTAVIGSYGDASGGSALPVYGEGLVQEGEEEAGNIIEGTVVDSDGKGVENALVLPMTHGGVPVRTDKDGKFQLAGPDESTERRIFYLIVRHLERNLAAARSTRKYTKPLEITLQKGITLFGYVKDTDGNPIANAKVNPFVYSDDYEAGFGYTKFPRADEKGFYQIKALPSGLSYGITVSGAGFESSRVELGELRDSSNRQTDIILLREGDKKFKAKVSVETRFILVPDGFLEDIDLELFGAKDQEGDSDEKPEPEFLDDVQVEFIIKATQQHKESKTLTAPKLNVYDNEPSNISVLRERPYIESYTEVESVPDKPEPKLVYFKKGVVMDITPNVTEDKKNIMVEFEAELSDMFLGEEHFYKGKHPYHKPEISRAIFTLAAVVPDGKTLLVGPKPYTDYNDDSTKAKQNVIMLLKATIVKGAAEPLNPSSGSR